MSLYAGGNEQIKQLVHGIKVYGGSIDTSRVALIKLKMGIGYPLGLILIYCLFTHLGMAIELVSCILLLLLAPLPLIPESLDFYNRTVTLWSLLLILH